MNLVVSADAANNDKAHQLRQSWPPEDARDGADRLRRRRLQLGALGAAAGRSLQPPPHELSHDAAPLVGPGKRLRPDNELRALMLIRRCRRLASSRRLLCCSARLVAERLRASPPDEEDARREAAWRAAGLFDMRAENCAGGVERNLEVRLSAVRRGFRVHVTGEAALWQKPGQESGRAEQM